MGGWFLAVVAAAFWTGIVLGDGAPSSLAWAGWLGAGGLILLGAPALTGRRSAKLGGRWPGGLLVAAAVVAAFGVLGAADGILHAAHMASSPLHRLAGRSVEGVGSLGGDPAPKSVGWSVPLNVDTVTPSTPGWPSRLRGHDAVWLEGRGPPPHPVSGDRGRVRGPLRGPPGD